MNPLEAVFLLGAGIFLHRRLQALQKSRPSRSTSAGGKMAQLQDYAGRLFKEKKYLAAEKAYMDVLKLDHKNILAYNRLGMIYSAQRNFDEAVECFHMVVRLKPNAASYYNLGLAYLENKNYLKAVSVLEKSLIYEVKPERYIALAKAYGKLANWSRMIELLEKGVELDPSERNLKLLADTYRARGMLEQAKATRARLKAAGS